MLGVALTPDGATLGAVSARPTLIATITGPAGGVFSVGLRSDGRVLRHSRIRVIAPAVRSTRCASGNRRPSQNRPGSGSPMRAVNQTVIAMP
jgi:hypothetical protein